MKARPIVLVLLVALTSRPPAVSADSRKRLQSGRVAYLAPPLYWSASSTGQNVGAVPAPERGDRGE